MDFVFNEEDNDYKNIINSKIMGSIEEPIQFDINNFNTDLTQDLQGQNNSDLNQNVKVNQINFNK